jgi:TonB family protein
MRIFSVPFLALVLTAFSQTTEQSTGVEQPSVPPDEERAYSERERIALCKKKQNALLAPSEPQPLKVEGKVTRPTILRQVKPVYAVPPVDGTVILQVAIDEDGCVRDTRILRGVNRYQDSAALNAVRQWVFLPATLEGKPVRVNYVLTINTARSVGAPPKQLLEEGVGWTRPADKMDEVFVFNVYRTGGEKLPRTLDGCEFLSSVSATVPEIETAQSIGIFNPSVLLPTIKARAARKSANTVVVSFVPGASEFGRRTLRGTAFRCGNQPLPPELGEPLR